MTFILKWIQLASAGVWMGTLVFFSFFAAPAIFKALPKETAGEVLAAVISKYYLLGYICGVACVFSSIALGLRAEGRNALDLAKTVLFMGMMVSTLYAGTVLHRDIQSVKHEIKAHPAAEKLAQLESAFSHLHRRSVMLNAATLAAGFVVILILSHRLSS